MSCPQLHQYLILKLIPKLVPLLSRLCLMNGPQVDHVNSVGGGCKNLSLLISAWTAGGGGDISAQRQNAVLRPRRSSLAYLLRLFATIVTLLSLSIRRIDVRTMLYSHPPVPFPTSEPLRLDPLSTILKPQANISYSALAQCRSIPLPSAPPRCPQPLGPSHPRGCFIDASS